jgi:hypothetical protein
MHSSLVNFLLVALVLFPVHSPLLSCILVSFILLAILLSANKILNVHHVYAFFHPVFVAYISIGMPLFFVIFSPLLNSVLVYLLTGETYSLPLIPPPILRGLSFAVLLLRLVPLTSSLFQLDQLKSRLSSSNILKPGRSFFSIFFFLFLFVVALVFYLLSSFGIFARGFVLGICSLIYLFAIPRYTNHYFNLIIGALLLVVNISIFNQGFSGAFASNRTALLFPFILTVLNVVFKLNIIGKGVPSYLSISKFKNVKSKLSLKNVLTSVVLFLSTILAFIASSSKFLPDYQTYQSVFLNVYLNPIDGLLRINNLNDLASITRESASLPILINFQQLLYAFYPSQIFDDKPEMNITNLLFNQGFFPTNLHYEPFLNYTIDLGILGIAFYSLVLILFFIVYLYSLRSSRGYLFLFQFSMFPFMLVSSIGYFQTISTLQVPLLILCFFVAVNLVLSVLRFSFSGK